MATVQCKSRINYIQCGTHKCGHFDTLGTQKECHDKRGILISGVKYFYYTGTKQKYSAGPLYHNYVAAGYVANDCKGCLAITVANEQ